MMKTRIVLLALLAAAPLWAEEKKDALAIVGDLKAVIEADKPWKERWTAYRNAKDAVDAAEVEFLRKLSADQKKTLKNQLEQIKKDRGPEHGDYGSPAGKAYEAIRKDVADSIRRDALPPSGWIMALVGIVLLWGGFAFCVGRAVRTGKDAAKG